MNTPELVRAPSTGFEHPKVPTTCRVLYVRRESQAAFGQLQAATHCRFVGTAPTKNTCLAVSISNPGLSDGLAQQLGFLAPANSMQIVSSIHKQMYRAEVHTSPLQEIEVPTTLSVPEIIRKFEPIHFNHFGSNLVWAWAQASLTVLLGIQWVSHLSIAALVPANV